MFMAEEHYTVDEYLTSRLNERQLAGASPPQSSSSPGRNVLPHARVVRKSPLQHMEHGAPSPVRGEFCGQFEFDRPSRHERPGAGPTRSALPYCAISAARVSSWPPVTPPLPPISLRVPPTFHQINGGGRLHDKDSGIDRLFSGSISAGADNRLNALFLIGRQLHGHEVLSSSLEQFCG